MKKKLLLLFASVFVALVIAELVVRFQLRAWPFQKPLHVPRCLTERDRTLRWRFSASDGRNSLGLRNREVGPRPAGTFRVLFLGDSLVWTSETTSGQLYTEVLERSLNERAAAAPKSCEVINAGVPGYTTYQELEFLKIYGLEMQPDLVVLGFVFNDVYYKYIHRPTERSLLGFEPDAHRHRFDTTSFPGVLVGRSYLAHKVVAGRQAIGRRASGRRAFPFEQQLDFYLAWKEYGWGHTRDLIEEMRNLLKTRGVRLVVVVYPVRAQMVDRFRNVDEAFVLYPQSRIGGICRDLEIPMLDLTEPIYTGGGRELFKDHLHLNPAGNDVVADELERWVGGLIDGQP